MNCHFELRARGESLVLIKGQNWHLRYGTWEIWLSESKSYFLVGEMSWHPFNFSNIEPLLFYCEDGYYALPTDSVPLILDLVPSNCPPSTKVRR